MRQRTSASVATLFDMGLRAFRRDRAARSGPELFLFEHTFADCLERIALVERSFPRGLLIGCPDPGWPERLHAMAGEVEVHDPGALFAARAGGETVTEDAWNAPPAAYDLILAIGTLDTVNGLPLALRAIRHAMRPDGLFIGAMSGGDTLPRLRAAMRSADQVAGEASAHVHPRVEAAALSPLLAAAGFSMPVVDVDRVPVSYGSLMKLVADLRAMGATNILTERSRRPLSKRALAAATESFADRSGRTVETYEVLHFAAWTPQG
jgi:NADH dehydrogenase [ubiquinone] 1 alpha subcomplex assembly factor 5